MPWMVVFLDFSAAFPKNDLNLIYSFSSLHNAVCHGEKPSLDLFHRSPFPPEAN